MAERTDEKTGGRPYLRRIIVAVVCIYLLPIGASTGALYIGEAKAVNWWDARNDTSGQAPDPATTQEAVLQMYAARAFGWRGAFGVHTWFAVKPTGADHFTRVEVIGWAVRRGQPAVRVDQGIPDGYWYGSLPRKLMDLRGEGVDRLIEAVITAANQYPHRSEYRVWPGPNSNTFIAFIGRRVPALKLDLPPTAVGKDYLPNGGVLARAPSGTGYQVSLFGLFGILVAADEGLEINLLGLTAGIDVTRPALKLPGLGRIGLQ